MLYSCTVLMQTFVGKGKYFSWCHITKFLRGVGAWWICTDDLKTDAFLMVSIWIKLTRLLLKFKMIQPWRPKDISKARLNRETVSFIRSILWLESIGKLLGKLFWSETVVSLFMSWSNKRSLKPQLLRSFMISIQPYYRCDFLCCLSALTEILVTSEVLTPRPCSHLS